MILLKPLFGSKARLCSIAWLLMLLSGSLPLRAEQLVIQAWKSGQGLRARGIATCIVGTDGTIWIGAIGDLIRFDGVVFERVPFKLPQGPNSNRITALWEDARRRVWCGYETGDVVVYDQTNHKAALMPIRWEREEIRAIHGDPEGEIWLILDDHSLVRLSDGHSSGPKNLGGRQGFIRTNSGRLLAERGGSLYEWRKGGAWNQVMTGYNYLSCAIPSHKGGLWLVNPNWEEAFHVLDDGTLVETRPLPHQVTSALFVETKEGDLLAAVHALGIVAIRKGGEYSTYTTQEGLASLWIQQMVEDQDGNVIAISYEDLSILRQSKASSLAKIQDFGGARLTGVSGGANGRIWIITEGAGLYSLFRNTLKGIGKGTGLGNPNLWSILEDSKGHLWAGSWGEGLYGGWPDHFAPEQNWQLPDRRMVTAIIQASDGGIWAGTGEGLGRRNEEGWTWYVRSGDTQIGNVRTLCEGKNGRIWFGTTGNGVGYVEKGAPSLVAPDSDAGCRYVNCILSDSNDGIWVGTEGAGLYHWAKGRWSHLRTEDGLPSNDLFHMANDGEGRIWFTSSAGVFFVQSDELASCAAGETGAVRPTIINREDGLPSDQCAGGSQNAAHLSADGRYYVPTSGGLAMIDTRAIQAEEKQLHPSISRVLVDDKEVLQTGNEPVRCPPRTQSLRVEYSAPTLTHPNLVKYAYRLDGDSSSPWMQLGASRSLQLQRVPAGLHRLELIAWSSGFMDQAPTVALLIEQEPTLTETLWFRMLVLALALPAIGGAVWFYTRRSYIVAQRKLELETAIEKERRRIARDIHDELGVLLAQVMLLIQGGKPAQDNGLEPGLLPRLHTKAKEITKALDELVWTINPSYDTLEGLVLYVSRLSQETISNAGLRCRLRINEPAYDVALDSGARHQLIMCLKEAIANAIKHSGCTQIEVLLSVEEGVLKLAVHDNGSGFVPEAARSSSPADTDHSGCENMRARMQELDGRLVLESSPGQGTRVQFEYPLPLQ